MFNALITYIFHINQAVVVLIDGADVLYNKFNFDSSAMPNNPPQQPNSNYSCVVATTGQWRVSRCNELHRVVCQSDTLIGTCTNLLLYTKPFDRTYKCTLSSVFLHFLVLLNFSTLCFKTMHNFPVQFWDCTSHKSRI